MKGNKVLFVVAPLVALIFILQLLNLQILSSDFSALSQRYSMGKEEVLPERGYIYDRNGTLLVGNRVSYDLMVIPENLDDYDLLELSKILNISVRQIENSIKSAKRFSYKIPSPVYRQLPDSTNALLQEQIWKFPGFILEEHLVRDYRVRTAFNLIGYVNEATEKELHQTSGYYALGDKVGRSGIEFQYEEDLRGGKGVRYFRKDKFNRDVGSFDKGNFDISPINAKDIVLTIDAELQQYGESLLTNKRGGIVAIQPKTGEVLSLVSIPNFEPDSLKSETGHDYLIRMTNDTLNKPFFDRGLQAQYAPGSPFKTLNALIGLQEKVIEPDTRFTCNSGHYYGKGFFMRCLCKPGTNNDLLRAISRSCNTYFSNVYQRIIGSKSTSAQGIDNWKSHLNSFGLGNYLGYDLAVGRPGFVPGSSYYDLIYGSENWKSTNTISNAIGQGEMLSTPIQMANFTVAIANRGHYIKPHFTKKIGNLETSSKFQRQYTTIDQSHFEVVIEGMRQAVLRGTSKIADIKGIEVCGKTGTVENFALLDGKKTQLTDHSVFIAFAPKDDPEIAITVFVENGYWGSRWAAPIASLMIEKYLRGETSRKWLEERMLNGTLEEEYQKPLLGVPFEINQ